MYVILCILLPCELILFSFGRTAPASSAASPTAPITDPSASVALPVAMAGIVSTSLESASETLSTPLGPLENISLAVPPTPMTSVVTPPSTIGIGGPLENAAVVSVPSGSDQGGTESDGVDNAGVEARCDSDKSGALGTEPHTVSDVVMAPYPPNRSTPVTTMGGYLQLPMGPPPAPITHTMLEVQVDTPKASTSASTPGPVVSTAVPNSSSEKKTASSWAIPSKTSNSAR